MKEHPLDFLNPNEDPEGNCNYCGVPTDSTYCSRQCEKTDVYE